MMVTSRVDKSPWLITSVKAESESEDLKLK